MATTVYDEQDSHELVTNPLRMASVKSNIGHAEVAAGMFSIIKVGTLTIAVQNLSSSLPCLPCDGLILEPWCDEACMYSLCQPPFLLLTYLSSIHLQVIEMLRRRVFLPTAGVTEPRKAFDWDGHNARIQMEAEPFSEGHPPVIVGVNSFGVSQ